MEALGKRDERYLLQALEHEGMLRACLYRFVRNRADVDDLLQETYARLLIAGAAPDQPEIRSIRAFALTVARNVALDWMRHRSIIPIDALAELEMMDVLDEGEQVEEIVNTHQELGRLSDAIAALPDRCRQVFTLRKVYGFSQQEIAKQLGITENTVEVHLQRAAHKCAQALFDVPVSDRPNSFFARLRRHLKPRKDSARGDDD
jgi:RNA polymerase sigma factor (sigma-70 family)